MKKEIAKLRINKNTISNLNASEMNKHAGGDKSKNCTHSCYGTCGGAASCKRECTGNCTW